jgi:hypothetical protein
LVLVVLAQSLLRLEATVLIPFLATSLLLAAEQAVVELFPVLRPALLAVLAVAQDGLLVEQEPPVKETMAHHLPLDLMEVYTGLAVVGALVVLDFLKTQLLLVIQAGQEQLHQ